MKKIVISVLIISLLIGIYGKSKQKDEVAVTFYREVPRSSIQPTKTAGRDNKTIVYAAGIEYENYKHFSIFDPESKRPSMDMVRKAAATYKIDYEALLCVFNNESGVESTRRDNGQLKCGDSGASCGIGQIQLPTWKSIRKHAGWSQEDLRADDWENIKTTAYGISTVWREHWTGVKVCRGLGYNL